MNAVIICGQQVIKMIRFPGGVDSISTVASPLVGDWNDVVTHEGSRYRFVDDVDPGALPGFLLCGETDSSPPE